MCAPTCSTCFLRLWCTRALFEAYTASLFVIESQQAEAAAIAAAEADAQAAEAAASAALAAAAEAREAAAAALSRDTAAALAAATAAAAAAATSEEAGQAEAVAAEAALSSPVAAVAAAAAPADAVLPPGEEPDGMRAGRMDELRKEQVRPGGTGRVAAQRGRVIRHASSGCCACRSTLQGLPVGVLGSNACHHAITATALPHLWLLAP